MVTVNLGTLNINNDKIKNFSTAEIQALIIQFLENDLNLKSFRKNEKKLDAFGILQGRIKDPIEWQQKIREDEERDIYSELKQ